MLNDFIDYAKTNGVKRNDISITISKGLIKSRLKAGIAKDIWKNEGFYPIIHKYDNILLKAVEILE